PLSHSVDHADTSSRKLLHIPKFEPAAAFRRREERLPFAGDQRINNEPELVHKSGIDEARRRSRTPDQIDVLAGLLLQASNLIESPDEARPGPESRGQSARQYVMGGLRGEAGPFDLVLRRRPAGPEWLVRLILNRGPVPLVARVHVRPEEARVDLRHQVVV